MVARPNDKLSAIRRPDNPSARSRKASRIFRIGNLFIGFLSVQNERKNNHVKDRLAAAKSQVNTGWPDAPVSLAGLNRYGWPDVIGISGRMTPEYAIAVGECGYPHFDVADNPDDVEIDIYEVGGLKELAEQFVDEGLFGDIPERLEFYINYDAIARDLAVEYSETDIAGQRLVYRCG